ncbi:hypothetical protein FACS1894200_02510 [Spirochaetia bacterium]|nr:hypothetical protein FACS1894200_02510 [Spirochaetia bacterium]
MAENRRMWVYNELKPQAPLRKENKEAKERWVYNELKPQTPLCKENKEAKEHWVYDEKKITAQELHALKWDLLLASSNKDFYDMLIEQGVSPEQALDEALSIS